MLCNTGTQHSQRGNTLSGLLIGLLIGVAIAAGLALYINFGRTPFVSKPVVQLVRPV